MLPFHSTCRWQRRHDAIAQDAALGGMYVIRTSVSARHLDAAAAVAASKSWAKVERAIRSRKIVDLHVRPDFHSFWRLSKFGL